MDLPLRGEAFAQKMGLALPAIPLVGLALGFGWAQFGIAVPLLLTVFSANLAVQFHRNRRRSSDPAA